MKLFKKRFGKRTHHDESGKTGVQKAVQDRLVLQFLFCLNDGNSTAETGQFILNPAEDSQIVRITVFPFGGGQKDTDGETGSILLSRVRAFFLRVPDTQVL